MDLDPAQYHFVEDDHGCAFFPWGWLFFFGALWAFEVPTAESQRLLSRQVRVYHLASLILPGITVPIGIWFNLVMPCLAAGVVVPLVVYSICICGRVSKMVRIPQQRSIALLAGKLGATRLWQNGFLGVLTVAFTLAFFPVSMSLAGLTVGLAVNAGLAYYALRFVST